jgi:hypothetical protein
VAATYRHLSGWLAANRISASAWRRQRHQRGGNGGGAGSISGVASAAKNEGVCLFFLFTTHRAAAQPERVMDCKHLQALAVPTWLHRTHCDRVHHGTDCCSDARAWYLLHDRGAVYILPCLSLLHSAFTCHCLNSGYYTVPAAGVRAVRCRCTRHAHVMNVRCTAVHMFGGDLCAIFIFVP